MTTNAEVTAQPVRLIGYFICLAGFLLCVLAFYPGYMSPDSIESVFGRVGLFDVTMRHRGNADWWTRAIKRRSRC